MKSDLGLTPTTAGTVIRIPLPPLTEERRKELTKVVRARGRERARRGPQRAPRRDDEVKEMLKEKLIIQDEDRQRRGRDPEAHRPARRRHRPQLADKEKELMQV